MTDIRPKPPARSLREIRPTVLADAAALKVVLDATELFPSELLDDMLTGSLNGDRPDEYWLTVDDGGPVGFAYYVPERMTQGTWNLLAIAVHPERQERGHGAALMRHVEATLTAAGERILLVETSGLPAFERTRSFYRHLQYEEEARIRDFYEAGDDKIVFRKALPDARGT